MPSYFLTKIRYNQQADEAAIGTSLKAASVKTVTEAYLVDAVSFTDAEARTIGTVAGNTPDFEVLSIARYKLSDLFRYETGENWYRCRMQYTTEDERTGKEKKVTNHMLVNADTPTEAVERIRENLKNMLVPYEVNDVVQTPILEVVEYEQV